MKQTSWCKRLMAAALSIALACGCVRIAAAEGAEVYVSDSGYTAQKITHPGSGVEIADGIVDYTGDGTLGVNLPDGIGDRGQNYTWGSIGYGDYMYIGTCYGAWMNTLSSMKTVLGHFYEDETMKAALDEMFHGDLYTAEPDGGDSAGILLKLNVKTGAVKILMSKETTGTNCLFRNAVEFQGKLYFCGAVNAVPCIYQIDPATDECKQVYVGMTLAEYAAAYRSGLCSGIRGMCVYDDQLIISCVTTEGAVICATKTPEDPDSFHVIARDADLFHYPAYHYCDSIYGGSIFDMTQFGKSLYVSICTGTPQNAPDGNTMQSFALVRGDMDAGGGWTWTAVAGDQAKDGAKYSFGIDPQRTRSGAANLMVFQDHLYIGEYNDEEIAVERMLFDNDFTFMNANFAQSINLYRMDYDENVELVVGDADNMFQNGSLSGLSSGFGRNENQYIWKMQVYDGKLFVGTYDASSFLLPVDEYVNDASASEEWKKQVDGYVRELCGEEKGSAPKGLLECAAYLAKADFGFDLYVTEDGVHFQTITTDGFGDQFNHGCRAFGVTDAGLYVGTANPFYGAQVWKLSGKIPAPANVPASRERDIVVLYTNDVHCGVDDHLGYAALAGYKAQLEEQYGADYVTLVDIGDSIQGDVIGALSDGSWPIDLMNQVGYDLAVPGNHEFDYGVDQFLSLTRYAKFPYICCNFVDLNHEKLVLAPYQIISYDDVQVAYIGIDTPESIIKSTPTHFQDETGNYIYGFCGGKNGQELYDRVQQTVDEVREQGADYVVVLGHLGVDPESSPWMSTDVIAHTTGIDAFLDGHSHSTIPSREVPNQAGETVLLTQTGTKLSAIGQLTIAADGTLSTRLVTEYNGGESTACQETNMLLQSIRKQYEDKLSQTVAESQVLLTIGDSDAGVRLIRSQETNMGDLCADAYRIMLGANIGWINGGGIRASIQPGSITYGDIIQVHPYGNMICLVEVSGQQIIDALEHAYRNVGKGENGGFLHISGLRCAIDESLPSSVITDDNGMFLRVDGPRRVYDVQVLGADGAYAPIDPEGRYSLACHDYMLYSQGDGFSMFGKDNVTILKDQYMVDSDVLIRYITDVLNGVVTQAQYGSPQGRIQIDGTAVITTMPGFNTYTVISGDTLWGIARKFYGTGDAWLSVYEANQELRKNPDRIYPGQILVLPAA